MTGTLTAEQRGSLRAAVQRSLDQALAERGFARLATTRTASAGGLTWLTARQLIVLHVQAGWRVSEVAAALGVTPGLLHVVVVTGAAPLDLAVRLRALADRPVPHVSMRPTTAAAHARTHRQSTWGAASIAITPSLLEQVWGPQRRAHGGVVRYRPPAGWTRVEGNVWTARVFTPHGKVAPGERGPVAVIAAVARRQGARTNRMAAQDLAAQGHIEWPATAAGVASLPIVPWSIPPYDVDGEA